MAHTHTFRLSDWLICFQLANAPTITNNNHAAVVRILWEEASKQGSPLRLRLT